MVYYYDKPQPHMIFVIDEWFHRRRILYVERIVCIEIDLPAAQTTQTGMALHRGGFGIEQEHYDGGFIVAILG